MIWPTNRSDREPKEMPKRKRPRRNETPIRGQVKKIKTEIKKEQKNGKLYVDDKRLQQILGVNSEFWLGYELENKNKPVVVAVVEKANNNIPKEIEGIKLLQRQKNEVSNEALLCLEKEYEKDELMPESVMSKMHEIIVKHSPILVKEHSNIQIISASRVKCRNFRSGNKKSAQFEKTHCIVIYVHVKGIIPKGEGPFPTKIENFPVDVREGCYMKFMPNEVPRAEKYFKNLTMGCNIETCYGVGTLGGFIQLPDKHIGCLTCWHIFDTVKSRLALNKAILSRRDFKRDVFQPKLSLTPDFKIGEVIEGVDRFGNDEVIGVDAALIKITEPHREPTPASLLEDGANFEFYDGKIIESFEAVRKAAAERDKLIKYGSVSGMTSGCIVMTGTFITPYCQQIEVNVPFNDFHQGITFSKPGDSGSLVFIQSRDSSGETTLRAFGLITGGTTHKTTMVTPIWAILDSFDLPRQFLVFDEQRFDKLYKKIKGINTKLSGVETKIDRLSRPKTRLSGVATRLNTMQALWSGN